MIKMTLREKFIFILSFIYFLHWGVNLFDFLLFKYVL